jgi:hypothetical protein
LTINDVIEKKQCTRNQYLIDQTNELDCLRIVFLSHKALPRRALPSIHDEGMDGADLKK